MSQRTRLSESYLHCRQAVLRARSNLGRAFWLLPDEQRRGMDALYAFARKADDLVDHPGDVAARREDLNAFRQRFAQALTGKAEDELFPAVIDTIERFEIPPQPFYDLLDGVEMDLTRSRYETWDELREYCRRVASTIGLACLSIWGCSAERAHQPAIDCGLALQLTNILRDLREDAQRGRVYLPQDELARYGVSEEQLLSCAATKSSVDLVRFQIERAKELYASAWQAFPMIPLPARKLFWLMHQTYYRLLLKVEREPEAVFRGRIQLSWQTKLWLATRATLWV